MLLSARRITRGVIGALSTTRTSRGSGSGRAECYSPPYRGPNGMAARVSLTLLGGFGARIGTRPVDVPLRKARALLAYLALAPGRAHSREQLAALLRGDRVEAHARNSLRQTLFGLRRTLPPCLDFTADSVSLRSAAVDVDATAFERLAATGTDEGL